MYTCAVLLWGSVCSPSPCDYNATTGDRLQALYCVNITNVYLLTDPWHLCYSHVRLCIKGCMNLPVDISCCLCLRCAIGSYTGPHTLSTRVDLWIFPSCFAWQPVLSVVGLRASWLPQCAPRVNPCVNVNSTKVYPCNCVCLVVNLGGPRVDTGGGDWLVLIIVVPTSVHQKVNLCIATAIARKK